MDAQTLAAMLLSEREQQAIQGANPYLGVSNTLGQFGPTMSQLFAQQPTRANARDMLIANAAGGLLSGFLGGMGKNYNETLTNRYTAQKLGMQLGIPGQVENLPNSLFKVAEQANIAEALKQAQAKKAMQDAVELELAKAGANVVGKQRGYELLNQGGATGGTSGPNLMNPIVQEKVKLENDLRKELDGKKEIKDFSQIRRYADALYGALKDPGSMTDLELTRYSILLIEPGMAVREGEQAAVANSQSIPDAWKGRIQKALENKGTLGDEARNGLARLAQRAYTTGKQAYDSQVDRFKQIGGDYGVNINNILPPAYESKNIEDLLAVSSGKKKLTMDNQAGLSGLEAIADKIKTSGVDSLTPQERALAIQGRQQLMGRGASGSF